MKTQPDSPDQQEVNLSQEMRKSLEMIVNDRQSDLLERARCLKLILDKKLYLDGYRKFNEYHKKELGLSSSQVFYLIGGLEVHENLSKIPGFVPPKRFSHYRPLIAMTPAEQVETWLKLQKLADRKRINLKAVKNLVNQRFNRRKSPVGGIHIAGRHGLLANIEAIAQRVTTAFQCRDPKEHASALSQLIKIAKT